jgi:hypothetical protein
MGENVLVRNGRVTDEEYERRATVDRAKAQARRDCTLCDSAGYRNMYLCDHVNHDAKRRNHLRVVPSGDE